MLRFRKILLCNELYIILFFFILSITSIRIINTKESNYSNTSTMAEGTVIRIIPRDEGRSLYLKNKEIVMVYDKDCSPNISLGDKVKVFGTFNTPEDGEVFSYKKYLKRKNINYIVNASKIIVISKNKNIIYYLKAIVRKRINTNSYLSTFILGDKSFIANEVKLSFQENGISHLFAISGMHITLFVNFITKLIPKKYRKEKRVFYITTTFLLIYLLLVGFSPSMVRGILFYIFFSINKIFYFYIKKINLILLMIGISLLIDPYAFLDVGWEYSYLISISLLFFQDKLSSNHYLISLFKVSFFSFFVSVPITAYYFNQINILSIFLNLLYVPFVSIILFPLSLLTFIIKPLLPFFSLLVFYLEKTSLFFSKISFLKICLKDTCIIVYILYLLFAFLSITKNKKIYYYFFFILLLIHILLPTLSTHIKYLNVGQGDAIIIHKNTANILIDTGGIRTYNSTYDKFFYQTLKPLLKKEGINKIDYLIISHGDYDHMGEAINLVNIFKVEKVIFNCGPYNDLEKELIKVLDKKKIKYYSCIKELNIDNNKLYFLQTKEYDDENDNSNVIYAELNGYKFMFMGDAGVDKEKDILDKYNISYIDVLKVGHHGSKTSSGESFINEMNPKYSIISVGKNNRYGHPNKEVLDTLDNSKIYRTDQDGSIIFKIKKNKLKIETYSP